MSKTKEEIQRVIDGLSDDVINAIKYQAALDIVDFSKSCYWDSEDIINVADELFNNSAQQLAKLKQKKVYTGVVYNPYTQDFTYTQDFN